MPDDMREFAREARDFLDAHASRREHAQFRWGEGEDSGAYFRDDPPDVTERRLRAAKDWQRTRYENGFGWISEPVEYGGRGLDPVYETVYAGIESEYDVPDTGTLSAQALLASADRAACARYLPGIAAGDTTATLAVAEGSGSWDPAAVRAQAERDDAGDWRLTGRKSFVIDGTTAGLVLTLARSAEGVTGAEAGDAAEGADGLALFAVDAGAPGLRAEPMASLDATRPLAALTFDQVPAVLIGAVGQGEPLLSQVLDVACAALAAEQAGGARRCLEMSAEYARTRFQFGRAIGSFQAIKHKCADMLIQVELAAASAREAARLADEASPECFLRQMGI